MDNQIFKLFAFIAIIGFAFTSCQKEEVELLEKQAEFLTADKVEEIKFEETSFISTKSSFTTKQVFLDGGCVTINGSFFPTKIVGDQRWIILNYNKEIGSKSFQTGNTTHHLYADAMTLNGSVSSNPRFYEPTNLVEKSNWRIPTWLDVNHLHHMVYGDEPSIIAGLNMEATGMIKWDGVNASVHQNPTQSIFWNSDFTLGSQGQDTWHLFAAKDDGRVYGFQYQLDYPYAPIRLVQDVEPIQ
jgi:hypothetical protein